MDKITLATLPHATAQQVFDQVARHLLTQNKKSMNKPQRVGWWDPASSCMYRSPDGLMCAAGCLIADSEYTHKLEYKVWRLLKNRGKVPPHHAELIEALQDVHDMNDPPAWPHKLLAVAENFNLNWPDHDYKN